MKDNQDKLYDLKELRTIAAGDTGFLIEMVKLFISQNEGALQEIKNQMTKREYGTIKSILHKMKPSVMVMGVSTATEIIRQIEQLELSDLEKPVFSDLFQQLDETLQAVNEQLRML